jgi:hypothetical protein
MIAIPAFRPQLNKAGRWFVAIATGYGPDSHIGDFETEREAQYWISTRSKDWPHPERDGPGKPVLFD